MQFDKIIEQVKMISFKTVREECDDYFEAIILNKDLKNLTVELEKIFGLPMMPAKNGLSAKVKDALGEFGGIAQGQTLYFLEQDSEVVFAMFWPWQDKQHTTVKIGKK